MSSCEFFLHSFPSQMMRALMCCLLVRHFLAAQCAHQSPVKDVVYGRPMEQGRQLYICPVVSSIYLSFFSSPNLSRRRLDVCHTSTHGMERPFSPKNLSLPMGDLDPHLIHGSRAHPSPQPKRQLDRCSCLCRAH